MKKEIVFIGLAICSLAGIQGLAQEADASGPSATVSVTAETETDTTVQENSEKPKRKLRIERRLSNGGVEVEEFGDDVVNPKLKARRRVQVIEEGDDDEIISEDRFEVRPQIRVFPREKELTIRRAPGQKELRIELDTDDVDRPVLRREIRAGARRVISAEGLPPGAETRLEHVEEAIRHLRRAKMPEAAARLEAELAELRARQREMDVEGLNEQLRAMQKERDTLKEELRQLRQDLEKIKEQGAKDEPKAP
jgi:hypothetical protein